MCGKHACRIITVSMLPVFAMFTSLRLFALAASSRSWSFREFHCVPVANCSCELVLETSYPGHASRRLQDQLTQTESRFQSPGSALSRVYPYGMRSLYWSCAHFSLCFNQFFMGEGGLLSGCRGRCIAKEARLY